MGIQSFRKGTAFSRAARLLKDFDFQPLRPLAYATEVAAGAGMASNLPTRSDS